MVFSKCLARFLPVLIGDLVPEGDEDWDHFLQLMEIMDYIFSPQTTSASISFLRVIIEDYLTEFKQLYLERRLTPKTHYMIHIPSWMSRYGNIQ